MSQLPDHVDVIIVGTGLMNSILAAACSRIGKSVLHLDENSYYGNDWASFTFQQLLDWIKVKYPEDKCLKDIPDELINKSRLFCLDLAPRFLFSNGDMVELLVKSNVARYHEFKNNIRILCIIGDELQVMPCRRNEVFTSPLLSNLADKRRLMKFIELCIKYDSDTDEAAEISDISRHGDEPVGRYLENRGLKDNLREYIVNSMAMVRPSEPLRDACRKIKKFMVAIERYGRSPFLFPLYGCGEFPQSFCRLSAVFGGLYCLNTQIKDISLNKKCANDSKQSLDATPKSTKETSNFSITFSDENHVVSSDKLVVEKSDAIRLKLIDETGHEGRLSRAILVTKESIVQRTELDQDKDLISFLRIPPGDRNKNLVFLIELNSSALVCPKELNILYLWTVASTDDPENDLRATIDMLFEKRYDCLLWKFYYQQLMESEKQDVDEPDINRMPGLYITSPICDDIDYANIIKEAEHIFVSMCPDQEFLPRAPDPDEIIST